MPRLIKLDVFILGGEFNVLLDASERGQGKLHIRVFCMSNSVNIFASHLVNKIVKLNLN